jgi:hypothetical protein
MAVTPRIGQGKLDASAVTCVCGETMSAEIGHEVREDGEIWEWMWWRCDANPRHVSISLPMPAALEIAGAVTGA